MVAILLKYKAFPWLMNNSGKLPIDVVDDMLKKWKYLFAQDNKEYIEIKKLLIKYADDAS